MDFFNYIQIKLIVGANDARLGQSFGPIIGQYGINLKSFCDLFNKVTSNIYKGIPVRIVLTYSIEKIMEVFIGGFVLKFLIEYFFLIDKYNFIHIIYNVIFINNYLLHKHVSLISVSNVKCLWHYSRKLKILN